MNAITNKTSAYCPEIDGLRAIAVLSVIFFHAGLDCPGGFVGVDVFFVISGYLITGLILKDLQHGRFSMLQFWERRVRRILPALAVVVLASLVAGWFLFLPPDFRQLGRSVVAQAALASNVNFWHEAGYFDQAAELKPLLHTWSLAVEEQFYLLFPFLLVTVYRISRSSVARSIVLLGSLSFALSVYFSYRHPGANFYLLPTRAWEFLIGAGLAAMPTRRSTRSWITESSGWGGLAAILGAVFFYDHTTRFPGLAALLPCVGAALIIWATARTQTTLSRLLAAPALVFIGLISYSLYLWHWPLLAFARYLDPQPLPASQLALLLLASLLLATLSWKWVETPLRTRRLLRSRVRIFSFASIATAVFFLAGLVLYTWQGLPSRFPAEALRHSHAATSDYQFVQEMSYRTGLQEARAGDFVELGTGDKRMPITFLIWGDSHAAAILPIIDTLCKEHAIRGVAAMHAGTAPLVGYASTWPGSLKEHSIAYNDAVVDFVRSHHISSVLLVAKWAEYITASGSGPIRAGMLQTLAALEEHAPSIYILRQVPKPRWSVPRILDVATLHGSPPDHLGIPRADYLQEFQRQTACFQALPAQFPRLAILDPTGLFHGPNELCLIEKDGEALYCDDSHLSTAGATLLKPLLAPIFQKLMHAPALTSK